MGQEKLKLEVRDAARNIIQSIWNDLKASGEADSELVTIHCSDVGEIEFHFSLGGEVLGRCKVEYSPQQYIEALVADYHNKTTLFHEHTVEHERVRNFLKRRLEETVRLILKKMVRYFSMTLFEMGPRAVTIFHEATAACRPEQLVELADDHQTRALESFKSFQKTRKLFYEIDFRRITRLQTAPQVLFRYYFDIQYPLWKAAHVFYRRNCQDPNSAELVKFRFPQLPEDLIKELGGHGTISGEPRKIALEATARITGTTASLASLEKYLRKSDEYRRHYSDQEYKSELKRFEVYKEQQRQEAEILDELARAGSGLKNS